MDLLSSQLSADSSRRNVAFSPLQFNPTAWEGLRSRTVFGHIPSSPLKLPVAEWLMTYIRTDVVN